MRHTFSDVYGAIRRNSSWDHWATLYVALDVYCGLLAVGRAA